MPLTVYFFWIVYSVGVVAALFTPVIGMALYVLVYHMNPESQWWGASVEATGLRTSFVVAAVTAFGAVVRRLHLGPAGKQFPTSFVLTLLLCLLALGSLAWGVECSDRGLYQMEKLAKITIVLFLLVRCVRTPAEYQLVLLSWIAGVAYVGYEANGGAGRSLGGRLTVGIGGPDFAESSNLALHLVATLPLIGALIFMVRRWWARLLLLAVGALAVNTIVMTRTRNAIVGIALAALVCVLKLPRGYRLKGVAAVIVGTFFAVQLTDDRWWRRMQSVMDYQADASATGRLAYWRAAFDMVNDYPLGIGIGNFHHVVMDYVPGLSIPRAAHNTPLACLAELGWPGLLVFTAVLVVTWRSLNRVRRIARTLPPMTPIDLLRRPTSFHLGWHATALQAGLLGYLGCAMFTTRLYSEDLWLLIGLGMCLHNIARSMAVEHAAAKHVEESEFAPAAALSTAT